MKKLFVIVPFVLGACFAHAQVGTAAKEAGKATVEVAKEGKENVEGALTKEPKKSMHKAEAKMHKESAAMHGQAAKAAAKEVGK